MYYNTCPHCGAHLDPDERCDCLARVRGKKIRTGNCRIHGTMARYSGYPFSSCLSPGKPT